MNPPTDYSVAVVVRVGTLGQPAFQLRKGEEGLSVFDPEVVEPPLTDEEILDAFRPGSVVIHCSVRRIVELGLDLVATDGVDTLPDRLQHAHFEIRPDVGMSRGSFKIALRELENP